jgi:glycosyltransferase involved in cell wall biosynthesis
MILFVYSGTFPPVDGIATHVFHLALDLKEECEVVVKQKRGFNRIEEYGGIRTYIVTTGILPFVNNLLFSKAVKQIAHKINARIVHFHSPLVIIPRFSRDFSPKKILTVHSTMKVDTSFIEIVGLNAVVNKILGQTISVWIERISFKRADRIISVSPGVKEELELYYTTKSVVIVNEVSTVQLSAESKENLMVFVGRIGYRKGIVLFLEAILNSSDLIRTHGWRVEVLGGGPLLSFAKHFIDKHELGDIVSFTGVVLPSVVMSKLEKARLLVMTSTYETGPRVVLEALRFNTLVLATPVGIVPFIKGYGVDIALNLEDFVEKIGDLVAANERELFQRQKNIFGWEKQLKDINESELHNEYNN